VLLCAYKFNTAFCHFLQAGASGIAAGLGISDTKTPVVHSRRKDGVLDLERMKFEGMRVIKLKELELMEQRRMKEVWHISPLRFLD
jgi:hypothetical protein